MTNAPPSSDPADGDTLAGMVNTILSKFLQGVDDMLPARIISYDRATNRARVVPMVKILTTSGQQLARAQIASIPVLQLGGGGFVLNFPMTPGGLGWIKANDRDTSLMLQSYADSAPNSLRMHSFEDALFIPDVMRGWIIAAEDADNAVLQSLDGAVRVSIGAASLKLTAGAASLTMTTAGTVFEGPVMIPDGAVINGVPFVSHVHTGGNGGVGLTGDPQ